MKQVILVSKSGTNLKKVLLHLAGVSVSPILEQKWNKIGTNLSKLQAYIGGHISVDDIVLMVETSCNKIESIELISFESSKASMAAPHSRQSHQNFITWLSGFEALLTVRMGL